MPRFAWPILLAVLAPAHGAEPAASLASEHIRLEFNAALHSRVIARFNVAKKLRSARLPILKRSASMAATCLTLP